VTGNCQPDSQPLYFIGITPQYEVEVSAMPLIKKTPSQPVDYA